MTTETTVTIDGQEYRALVFGDRITIVTGPALLDRLAEIIAHRYPYEAELFPRTVLTLTQVTVGVMAEIAAMDGVQVLAEHVRGDEWEDAQHLADQVGQIVDTGWVTGVIQSVYAQHAQRQLPAGPAAEVDLGKLGRDRADAHRVAAEKTAVLRAAVVHAAKDGRAEAEIARTAEVDRMTVRSWLGK